MPCYTYACPKCKIQFEKIVSRPDPDIKQSCKICGTKSKTVLPIGKTRIAFRFNYMEP